MRGDALPLCLLVGFLGCGAQPLGSGHAPSFEATLTSSDATTGQVGEPQAADDTTLAKAGAGRQIIHRATLVLHVQDFNEVDRRIASLIKDAGGYIAQFREDRSSGAQRGGQWTVRLPVQRFDQFLSDVAALGVAERREVQADDVTEQYVDLEARLKNKQQLENRLLELVAKRGDEIKDVLALEGELSRVREEIERMQGRLRFLADRVALTTVEITAYERRDYRPPESTLAGRIAYTFSISLDRLRQCGETALLIAVALVPWIVALAVISVPLLWLARRRRRARPPVASATVV